MSSNQVYLDALQNERLHYARYGKAGRLADVDAEIDRAQKAELFDASADLEVDAPEVAADAGAPERAVVARRPRRPRA